MVKKQKHLGTLIYDYLPYEHKTNNRSDSAGVCMESQNSGGRTGRFLSYVQLYNEFKDSLDYMIIYQKEKRKETLKIDQNYNAFI